MSFSLRRQGILYVLSAPSGGGKSSILRAMRAEDPALGYSVSATTRPPRPGEVNGRDYNFYSDAEFDELIRQEAFYEWAHVHARRYGTLRRIVDAELDAGRDVILDIDVQGGFGIKKLRPDSVLVFLLPPSMEILEERLRGRKSDSEDVIELRLRNAREEIANALKYDYVVINEDFNTAVTRCRAILQAERARASRLTILQSGQEISRQ